jgi:NodT family efflux transporter outer membrane factor (OMF) lipoprotein
MSFRLHHRALSKSRSGLVSVVGGLAAVLLLTPACAVKDPPDAAALKVQALPTVQLPAQWIKGGSVVGPVADDWLASFHDEALQTAVVEAIAHNADLRLAAARVETAMLLARQAGARLYPSVDLLARGGGKMSGDNSGLQGAVLSITWELDLWARVRAGRSAVANEARAVEADFEYARQSLAAIVAKSWFLATEAGLQVEQARATVRDQDELVRLAETRSRVGVGNDEDVFVARASVATSRDTLRQLELAREQAIRALELLLGRYPAAAASVTPQLPRQPDPVPAGLPSELLERRPDVVAAERRVAAAFNRIQEAKAARLPAIALTSSVSSISSDLFVLQERNNPIWSAGANLLMPIFRGGALKTQVEIRTAEQRQAIAAYASVGLRAFNEVEDALASEITARDREEILAQAMSDYRRAFDVVQTQYKVGSTDLRFVTQRQLALNATQSALIRAQAEQRVQRVNLHLALGGSFGPRPEAPATPPASTPPAEGAVPQ